MSVLQDLIVKYNGNKNPVLYSRIVKEICTADKLWIAFSRVSNNCFIGNENGKAAVYIFSKKQFYEKFYDHIKEKGYEIMSIQNNKEHRMMFFADLYRSGFEVLVIDNGQTYLKINLLDIIEKPAEQTGDNKDVNRITNKTLMRTACWFMQENARIPANDRMWKLLFTEIFSAKYIVPSETEKLRTGKVKRGMIKPKKNSEVSFPLLTNSEGKSFYPFFTDWNEYRKFDPQGHFTLLAAGFEDFQKFSGTADGIVINPFGLNLILNDDMLKDIKKVSADAEKEKYGITVGEPKEYPVGMIRAMTDYFDEHEEINAAYFKLMYKDEEKSYLVALDFTTEREPADIYNEIATDALPFAEGVPIDFIDMNSDFARKVFGSSEPFYIR